MISGYTEGDLSGTNAGETDFVAVKLDPDGNVLWRWQVRDVAFICSRLLWRERIVRLRQYIETAGIVCQKINS